MADATSGSTHRFAVVIRPDRMVTAGSLIVRRDRAAGRGQP